ncbi:MAG: metalloregulator ArsR/SmtB family transcription factor [Roseinatronobacter sp.]
MESVKAASVFAALGHPDRLAVLRLLMRFAPHGQRPTEIAQCLGLKQNTLSHHLRDLAATGLLRVTRDGRSLFYAVNLDMTEALIGYLALDLGRARADLLVPALSPQTGRIGDRPLAVLFLCSANSARSIMAEAVLRDLGAGRFKAYSAGITPGPAPHPTTVQVLRQHGHDVSSLHSKPLAQFQRPGAPRLDVVITVCDRAATLDCPPWTGYPLPAHWGLPDPARARTDPRAAPDLAFRQTYAALHHRLQQLVALPFETLDRRSLQTRIDAINTSALTTESA